MVDRSIFVSGGRGFDSWLDGRILTYRGRLVNRLFEQVVKKNLNFLDASPFISRASTPILLSEDDGNNEERIPDYDSTG